MKRLTVAMVLAILALAGVRLIIWENDRMNTDWDHRNLDPRAGVVWLTPNHTQSKQCDGTTLVYRSWVRGGWSVSAVSSPECEGNR